MFFLFRKFDVMKDTTPQKCCRQGFFLIMRHKHDRTQFRTIIGNRVLFLRLRDREFQADPIPAINCSENPDPLYQFRQSARPTAGHTAPGQSPALMGLHEYNFPRSDFGDYRFHPGGHFSPNCASYRRLTAS